MALSEQLILDTQSAFRELDSLQGRLDNLSDIRLDITADTSGLNADLERSRSLVEDTADSFGQVNQQVTLTTDEYRQAVRAIDEGADAARAIAIATGQVTDEAITAEDALRRVAQTMDLSEDEARDMARSVGESTREAANLDADLRQVARSMGLSEDEARAFAQEVRRGEDATENLRRDSEGLAASWQSIRGLIVTAVAAFGVRGLVRQFGDAIESANALGESINAVRVTFDEGAEQIEAFAETAAQSAGLAASQAQQLVIPIGALLRNFGFDAREAGDAAVTLTQRAADLASVFNTDVEEALTALGSALRGESEPIRRFGGNITEARVQAFALAQGLASSVAEIDDAVKVQARFGLILQDTARAQGDFAATSDDAANRTRIFQASVEEARAEVGEALLPAFESLLESGEKLIPLLEDLAPVFGIFAEAIVASLDPLVRAADLLGLLIQPITDISDAISDTDVDTSGFENLSQATQDLIEPATNADAILRELFRVATIGFQTADLRAEFEQLDAALRAGIDPVEATIDAYRDLETQGELTADILAALLDVAQLTDEQLAGFLGRVLIDPEGLNTREIAALRAELDLVIERLGIARGAGLDFARGRAGVEEFAGGIEDVSAAIQRVSFEKAIRGVDDLDRAFANFDTSSLLEVDLDAEFSAQIAGIIDDINQLPDAFSAAGAAIKDEQGDIVDDFGEFFGNLQTELQARQDFAQNLQILRSLGFDDLADQFAAIGLDSAAALADGLADPSQLGQAEAALEAFTREIDQAFVTNIANAVAEGTSSIDDLIAAINSVEGLTSQARIQVLFEAIGAIDSRSAFESNIGQGGAPPPASAPATGGGVTVNQTNNFNTTPQPTTDTQRITNAAESAIKNLGPT